MGLPLVVPALALVVSALCDQPRLRPLRDAAETHLIVAATADTRVAGEGTPPFAYPDWQPPGKRPTIAGQVVVLERVSGASARLVRKAAGATRHVVLVPWDHDTGCQPIPWTARPLWIPVGQTGFVAARLRPRERWVDGMPTFDVSDAWREPYSVERMRAMTVNMPDAAKAIMTAEEYASLYAALPELSAWQRDPIAAVRPLRAWRDRNPHLAAKFPARWTMETTLRWAESQ
jgi:hypothetical protein